MAIVATVFFAWGIKVRNSPIFVLGIVFLIGNGMLLYATGLETNRISFTDTTKTLVDANVTTYFLTNHYERATVDNDLGIWATSWTMIIVGMVMIPVSLYLHKKVVNYEIR
jgi:hypothetical protein